MLEKTTPRPKAATIIDLAHEAQVSKTTVSRVLNGSIRVAPATRARVLDAATRLDYRVNTAARSLRTRRSALVGLLVPAIGNAVFGHVAEVLHDELSGVGVGVVVASSSWLAGSEVRELDALRSRGVDVLIVSLVDDASERVAEYLRAVDARVVLLDREVPGLVADAVLVDFRSGFDAAVSHLAGLGHESLAAVGMEPTTRAARETATAYASAVAASGATSVCEVTIGYAEIDQATGRRAADEVLGAGATGVVAFVPGAVAAGFLARLWERGVRVPEDISLVADEEDELAAAKHPRLTTIARIDEFGRAAARLVIQRLEDPSAPARVEVVRTHLRLGASTAPRRAA